MTDIVIGIIIIIINCTLAAQRSAAQHMLQLNRTIK